MDLYHFSAVILASVFVVSISLAAEIFLIMIKKIDMEKLKEAKEKINKKQKEANKLLKKLRETEEKEKLIEIQSKIAKIQSEILSTNFNIIKEKFKVSLITWGPALLVFIKLKNYMNGFSWSWFLIYFISFVILDKIGRKITKLDY